MNAKEVIRQVKEQCGIIRQVYWTACGGSLVDLYPAHCMLMGESTIVESGFYTAREFLLATPKKLGKESLVVVQPFRRHPGVLTCCRAGTGKRSSGCHAHQPCRQPGGQ